MSEDLWSFCMVIEAMNLPKKDKVEKLLDKNLINFTTDLMLGYGFPLIKTSYYISYPKTGE